MRYLLYLPPTDCINNCGFWQDVDDFKPGAFGGDPQADAADLEQATRHLPTEPAAELPQAAATVTAALLLAVPCEPGRGITYEALRAAANGARDAWYANAAKLVAGADEKGNTTR